MPVVRPLGIEQPRLETLGSGALLLRDAACAERAPLVAKLEFQKVALARRRGSQSWRPQRHRLGSNPVFAGGGL